MSKAFNHIKKNRTLYNISAIENACGIKRTTLSTAINRDQKTFRQWRKLHELPVSFFEGVVLEDLELD